MASRRAVGPAPRCSECSIWRLEINGTFGETHAPRKPSYDLVVVGSGIAGLYAALLAAEHGKVLVVTKDHLEESNTRYAQGGIAGALGVADSAELHLRDTISAGDGLCDPQAAAILTAQARYCIEDLLSRGVEFDREAGVLALTLEAAHSLPRVLHAGGDATGASIERSLVAALRATAVTVRENAICTELLVDGGTVTGIELLVDGRRELIRAPAVLLASGGAGQVYARTTNPTVATGDGWAIAYRAGAQLMDLEFVQFHPTALALDGAPSFLISEAVRGEGAVLRDVEGRRFMDQYHPDAELAPRDVVARALHSQMLATGGAHIYLDLRYLQPGLVEHRFPSIVAFCRRYNLDPVHEQIPVAPAAHYMMGGIRTDLWGRSSLPGLLACGEVACTGVHGANRLASNSLLEGLVFARRAALGLLESPPPSLLVANELPARSPVALLPPFPTELTTPGSTQLVQESMWRGAGLIRSATSLMRAREEIVGLLNVVSGGQSGAVSGSRRADHEAANLALVGSLIIESALLRTESRGAHFRTDKQARDPSWQLHTVISKSGVGSAPLTHTAVRPSEMLHA